MKKHKALLAILAITLGAGLALSACDNGTTGASNTPKTIEGLFNGVKPFVNASMVAWDNSGDYYRTIRYCYTHQAWETTIEGESTRHGEPPIFQLPAATRIMGVFYSTADSPAATVSKNVIRFLDSFFEDKYKLDSAPFTETLSNSAPSTFTRYYFTLSRDGSGRYCSSAVPLVGPWLSYYYQF